MDILKAHLPTEGQKLRLDAIGCTEDRSRLTKERAAAIIEEHEQKHKVYAPNVPRVSLHPHRNLSNLTYVKREPTPAPNGAEESWKVVLLAKSNSGNNPYKLEFIVQGSNLLAWCHCQGGAKSLCKHLLALMDGDTKILHDPNQRPEFGYLQMLPQFKSLKRRIDEHNSESRFKSLMLSDVRRRPTSLIQVVRSLS